MSVGAPSSEIVGGDLGGAHDDLSLEPILRSVEIIGTREGGFVDCWVPVDLIDREEVPVNEGWVKSLTKQMDKLAATDGGNGQATPITLGLIEGEPTLKIIDGFHRDAVIHARGENVIYATVKRTDWEGLFDFRILTAKDHAHVRFSRVVQWIEQAWQYSGLSDKITVEQAVLLYRFDTSGVKHGLSEADVEAAKSWVGRKEEQWDIAAMTMHSYLAIATTVDPLLVHSTREKKSGRSLEAPTQSIIRIFSKELPNNFELQNLVMDAAKGNNLPGPKITALCQSVKDMDPEQAAEFIAQVNWETWEPVYRESKKKALRAAHDPRIKGALVLDKALKEIDQVVERVALSLERNEAVSPEMDKNITAAQERVTELYRGLGRLKISLDDLRERGELQRQETEVAAKPKPAKETPALAPEDAEPTDSDPVDDLEPEAATPEPPEEVEEVDLEVVPAAEETHDDTAHTSASPPPAELSRFRNETREGFANYLSGRARQMPRVKTRVQIRAAEEVLAQGRFKNKALIAELESAIQDAKDRHI